MLTSLSTAVPRPMTLPGPISARSRTKAWSPTITPSPSSAPANTIAAQQTTAPAPSTSGAGASRGALEWRASLGGLPSTAWSWITQPSPTTVPGWTTTWAPICTPSPSRTPSPRSSPGARSEGCTLRPPRRVEPLLQPLEDAHHAHAALAVGERRAALAHALDEVLALDPQRLAARDPGTPDVPRARDVLAVGGGVLVEALVVHRHLPLEIHVVEGRHPARADDGEAPLLVRVEPRQVQVGGQPGREAQVGEDDVLDAGTHVGLPARVELGGLLVGEVQEDGDVVRAERPQRVLVRPQLAEVEAVGVDVVDVAELARVGDLLELGDAGVVLEQVADHQDPPGLGSRGHGALAVGDGLRQRLLDEAVLARAQHLLGQRGVGRHGGGEHDGVELRVAEQVAEVGREARAREAAGHALARRLGGVAAPGQLAAGQAGEVARQVGAPVAQPGDPHSDRHAPILRAATTRSPARPSP